MLQTHVFQSDLGANLGVVDWHIIDTADVIKNRRQMGWSDARITEWLLSPENQKTEGACPWGCTEEKVAAAFHYLATGQLPSNVKTESQSRRTRTPLILAGVFGLLAVVGAAWYIKKR